MLAMYGYRYRPQDSRIFFGAPLVGGLLGGLVGGAVGGALFRPRPYFYGPVPYGPIPYGPAPYGPYPYY
jgi:hypothetical protein